MRVIVYIVTVAIVACAGWLGGTLYPAPAAVVASINPKLLAKRAQSDFEVLGTVQSPNWAQVPENLKDQVVQVAQQAGAVIKIEHSVDEATKDAEISTTPASTSPSATGAGTSLGPTGHGGFQALV